jgi:hypothetical protein
MSEMTKAELKLIETYAIIYKDKINEFFDSSVPGLNINDPVMVLVRLMASKNPSSLMKSLLLSDNVGKLDMKDN